MSIADFQPKTVTVKYDGGEFTVRALSLNDVSMVIDVHQNAVDDLYAKIKAHEGEEFNTDVVTSIVMQMVRESPGVVARVIALAADEYDQVTAVLKMPLTVQIEALKAIGILTFKDLDGAKKFYADVMDLMRGIIPAKIVPLAEAAD